MPVGARFCAPVQTGPGAHPASYTVGNGSLSPGVKRPGRGVNQPRPYSAEVKERVELCPCCLLKMSKICKFSSVLQFAGRYKTRVID